MVAAAKRVIKLQSLLLKTQQGHPKAEEFAVKTVQIYP